jgi:hypothetical protein
MRIDIRKLISVDRQTLKYLAIAALCIAISAGLLFDLNRRNTQIRELTRDVEAKELQALGTQLPTEEEIRRNAETERLFNAAVVGEESIPLVFEEITRAGSDHRVQMEIQSEEKTIPETSEDPLETSARSLGIRQYLIVTVKFQAEYADAAQFLGSIASLPHALSLRSLELHREPPMVSGTMRLHVYKRGAA